MNDDSRQVKLVGKTGSYAGSELVITGGELTIGRNPDNDLVMDEKTISSHHSKIVLSGDHYEVHDLNSTNGTYVNGKQVTHAPLRSEDVLRFDIYEFTFYDEGQVARTVVSAAPNFEDKGTIARAPAMEAEPAPQAQPAQPAAAATTPTPKPSAAPKTTTAHFEPKGNLLLGLIIGLIFAVAIACGGFLLSGMIAGTPMQIIDQLKLFFASTSVMYTHAFWTNLHAWGLEAVIILVAVLLAPFLGGLFMQVIGKANRFVTAFVFSLFFVAIFFVVHLIVLNFNFDIMTMQMAASNSMGIYDGWLALVAVYGYFFGVSFVLSSIGSLFGRR